jgi:hypothetical protein
MAAAQAVLVEMPSIRRDDQQTDLGKVLGGLQSLETLVVEQHATLRTQFGFLKEGVDELSRTIKEKADRRELKEIRDEHRVSLAEVKAESAFTAGKIAKEVTDKLEAEAESFAEFRASLLETMREFKEETNARLDKLSEEVKLHEGLKNRVHGGWVMAGTIGAAIVATLGFLFSVLSFLTKKP